MERLGAGDMELDPWHIRVDLERVRRSQRQIDDELNHLSRIIHVLRNRQEWLIAKRDENLDTYLFLKSLLNLTP